ncbi:hypothetical protein [Deinococcus sp. NW-56]|uniref:hypothetical protein n=1 Tax=Deinococcus sp. NW-56 TaxID=2080419 RepID=UPI000CF4F1EB|nr:hypothetical protein [Deinococcus sp. NW-56]
MSAAARWGLRVVLALVLIAFGAWLTSPKSERIRVMCTHTPFCPDPLVYLQNAERQPWQQDYSTSLNLRPGEARDVTLVFDLNGVPADTPVKVVQVSRRWLNRSIGELSARPQGPGQETVFYRDPELTVHARRAFFQGGQLTVKVTAARDARPGLSVLNRTVQKQGTRWGSTGQATLRLWLHPPR